MKKVILACYPWWQQWAAIKYTGAAVVQLMQGNSLIFNNLIMYQSPQFSLAPLKILRQGLYLGKDLPPWTGGVFTGGLSLQQLEGDLPLRFCCESHLSEKKIQILPWPMAATVNL